jgi:hypothetical protein
MRSILAGLMRRFRAAVRVAFILTYGASLPVMADQNDTQTAVIGTEAADVITVSEPAEATAEVTTSTGEKIDANATAVDALGGDDTLTNASGLTASASASASLTDQPDKTEATATSTGVSAGEGDDQVTSSSTFTSTANAFGAYGGSLEYTQADPGTAPSKEVDISITTTGKAAGIITGAGADTVRSDALVAVTALATSGGTADQLN